MKTKTHFPTLAEFELMPYPTQRKLYEEKIKGQKVKGDTPFWVERLNTAIENNNPVVLMILPTLGKFYYNLKEETQTALFS